MTPRQPRDQYARLHKAARGLLAVEQARAKCQTARELASLDNTLEHAQAEFARVCTPALVLHLLTRRAGIDDAAARSGTADGLAIRPGVGR